MTDLSNFSMAQLRDLQTQVAEQIKAREKDEIARARQQILALAQSVGLPLDQIMKGGQEKKPVVARYRNPEDSAQVWTGRGRQPKWVKEYLEKPGNTLESLLIA